MPTTPAHSTRPKEIVIPLMMCADGSATPVVGPGDAVTVGQPIAKRDGKGAALHASVSGRVSAIELRPHPWGGRSPLAASLPGRFRLTLDAQPGGISRHLRPGSQKGVDVQLPGHVQLAPPKLRRPE